MHILSKTPKSPKYRVVSNKTHSYDATLTILLLLLYRFIVATGTDTRVGFNSSTMGERARGSPSILSILRDIYIFFHFYFSRLILIELFCAAPNIFKINPQTNFYGPHTNTHTRTGRRNACRRRNICPRTAI